MNIIGGYMARELRGCRILILSVTLLLGPTWSNSDSGRNVAKNGIPYVFSELCHPQPVNARIGLMLNWALGIGCAALRYLAADVAAKIAGDIISSAISDRERDKRN
jgi:hypothetical protein